MPTKAAVRKAVIQRLTALSPADKDNQAQQLIGALVSHPWWQAARTIGLTMSTSIELDTRPLIAQALAAGKTVTVPKTLPKRQMAFVALGPGVTFEPSAFGVAEPIGGQEIAAADHDLIIVPGLGFADDGSRLGFGAGYYDRYLAHYAGHTISLALAAQRFHQVAWPQAPFDIKIEEIISIQEDYHD